jgi:hypothetical protein
MRFTSSRQIAFWLKVLVVVGVYVGLQGTLLLATGDGWQKFWVLQPAGHFEYWDTIHYATLSINPICQGFYLLWPGLLQRIASPTTVEQALQVAILLSEVLFLMALPLALYTFEQVIPNQKVALLSFVLYALGPNAIFYAIGYTEALFSLLSFLFLLSMYSADRPKLGAGLKWVLYSALFGLVVLINLVRPALTQSLFAVGFALVGLYGIRRCLDPHGRALQYREITVAGLIALGSLVGYSLYGLYCLNTMGDFFEPFQAQVRWGRTVAFRPWLLLFPRSLLFDLHGLYTAFLVFAGLGSLMFVVWRQRQTVILRLPSQSWVYLLLIHPLVFSAVMAGLSRFAKRWTTPVTIQPAEILKPLGNLTVLYAIGFSGIHSVINLLANSGYLYSTARHYFASPYAFVAIGSLLAAIALPQLYRLTWGIAGIGLLWLGEQWLHYGSGRWLG